jgi:hypothetical protein
MIAITLSLSDNLTIQTAPRAGFDSASQMSKKAVSAGHLFTVGTATA